MRLCHSSTQLSRGSLFFSRQLHFLLLIAAVMAVLLALPLSSAAQVLITRQDVKHDVSPALSDLAKSAPPLVAGPKEAEPLRLIPLPAGLKPPDQPDSVLQRTTALAPLAATPAIIQNFDGIGQGVFGSTVDLAPPDTNGAVGLTQYVQWVNVSFAVFDKATTNLVLGPLAGNTLWTGFGGDCETTNDGDPVVLYDKLADRWIFSQFSVERVNGPFLQCVAVSTSSDATGTYNRYAFSYSNFDDYPKMGVWPDAYYVTFNMFGPTTFVGADACAYDRNAMLNGQPATQVCFQQGSSVGSLLPSDVDGHTAPPAGAPNYMLTFGANSLNLYQFHVDFATPTNSTFTGPTVIPVAPFTPLCNGGINCVPQSGTATLLDSLGDRLMFRLAYRNFGDHESLVVNHSVASGAGSGVRWYEVQNPGGTPVVAQQSTFAPDDSFRWMGSIAMDASGDIALGYSVSSATAFPSIAFTGRIPTDPASTMGTETTIMPGGGSQTFNLNRWGDYSAMQVDPSDDCTFWYTNEYLKTTGSFNWNTRIANFKFPGCGVPDLAVALSHTGNFTQGQTGATYTVTVTNTGGKDTAGTVTVTDALPAKLTATAASGTGWTCTTGTTTTCTRTDVLSAGGSYPPITLTVNVASDAPGAITNTASVSGGGDKNPGNNTASDTATVIQQGADLAVTKTHIGKFIQGQTGSYTITVKNVGLSPTDGTVVTITDTLPSALTSPSATGSGWTCNASSPVICTRNDVLASNASYPPITLTVNVSATAPASVINTATVAGGANVNPLNDTASDPTAIISPPPDLTITKTHTGTFNQGQINAVYTLTVQNVGTTATSGLVTVTDTLPAGFTASFLSGLGWICNSRTASCNRNDALASNASYPPITVGVNIPGNAPASVINTAQVSGGGEVNTANDIATDPTTINPAPDLTITSTHAPDPFVVAHTGTYTITVSNAGSAATSGTVTVNDFVPFGLTVTALSATGWNCSQPPTTFVSCSRSDALAAAGSYPAIALTVSVNGGGPVVTNTVTVSGGGELNTANDSATDTTNISAPVLSITKTHTGTFTVGQPGAYTITVGNTGQIATIGAVNVTDLLPQGFTVTALSAAGWNCSTPPTTFLSCTRSDSLPTASSYPPINLTVSIGDTFASVTNTATATGGGDSVFRQASDTATVNVPALAITKTHTGDFTAGQTGNYKITVSNTGTTATVGVVTVNDLLPFGLSAIAAGGTGWSCGTMPTVSLICTRSDSLAPNSSYPPLTVVVQVTAAGPTALNTATVTGGGDASSHTANDLTNINSPILSIIKSHAGNFTIGQNGAYTISVSNTGKQATSGIVTVSDSLPSGMTATAITATGWNCASLPTTFVNCTRSDALAIGSSYPAITLTVSVNGGVPIVTNSATASGGGDPNLHFASDGTVVNGPLLNIAKTHTGNFVLGQSGTYTITVNNGGTAATSGTVTVTDPLPQGLSATSVTGTGWSCTGTTSVTCTRSDALAAATAYPPITLTVSINSGGFVINSATVTGGGDPLSHQASDFLNITGPVLAITKSHVGDFTVGQQGSYTITVSNTGAVATSGLVTVSDSLPQGMTAATASGTGWTCTGTSFVSCTRSDALAASASYPPITITVNVGDSLSSEPNLASVSGGGDSNFHSVSDITNINAPTLAITKTHTGDFTAGQTGVYTISVGNTGKAATVGTVTVSDSLPQGMSLSTVSGTGWGCTGTTFVVCTRSDSLPVTSSYPPISLTVNVGNSAPTVTNTATVIGGGDAVTHSASDPTTIGTPTLSITKTHTGDFTMGQSGTYTITVGNVGSIATVGTVTMTDFLPFSMQATSISGTGWGCTGSFFVTCTRSDSLAPASSYPPITINVSVGPGVPSATNTASVTGGGDGLIHNASDPTNVVLPLLAITSSHTGNFAVGQTGDYTITVSNASNVATLGTVTVNDALPPGLTATALNAVGWNCSILPVTNLNCTRNDSLAGSASYPSIIVTTAIDASVGATVINQTSVIGGGDVRAHSVSDVTGIILPDLAVSESHNGSFFAGQTGVGFTISISNVGTVATAGGALLVTSIMPAGLTATAASGTGWNCSILPGVQTEMDCGRAAGTLLPGTSYPPITLTADVGANAPPTVTNTVNLFGVGEANFANNVAADIASVAAIALVPSSSTSLSLTAGASGTFVFAANISTAQSPGTVTFTASGLPANSTATFSPASVNQSGTITLTLNTSGNGHTASLAPSQFNPWLPTSSALLVFFGLLAAFKSHDQTARKRLRLAAIACSFAIALFLTGCGGGGGGVPTPGPTPTPSPVTPSGTFIITVTATSSTPGVAPASTPIALVVK